ncbi:MAG: carbohydrate ABC transporter permease [Oscillospiraceae bacterium]|nr:carbohydrate ABC transporter permease [Oscillospiraceae bacterium]
MKSTRIFKIIIYPICVLLSVMSILPFWVMFMNGTRSTPEIQRQAFSMLPSVHLFDNLNILLVGKSFDPWIGFVNSLTISTFATLCAVYFSSLTAYALVAYRWKAQKAFFAFILAVMMIPAQVTTIGFYQFMWSIGMTNSFLPLIIPAVASPAIVFFMRQYLYATLSIDIVNSGRIDGAGEFHIFNAIIIPIMKPAIATQAIFVFVATWNNFFLPLVLLTDSKKYTMPIMVSLLRGDTYRTEFGTVYLALSLSVLPLFVMYFTLSRYIIAGVALGGVKE